MLGVELEEVSGDEDFGEDRLEARLARLLAHAIDHLVGAVEEQVADAQKLLAALAVVEPAPGAKCVAGALHRLSYLRFLHVGHRADGPARRRVDRLDLTVHEGRG